MKKILIVDDDPVLLSTLADNLTKEGFEIIKAENGEKGLASALDVKPDLILLDIIMPLMDGMSMLKILRQDSWGKNAEVILLTNLSDKEKIADAVALGSFEYLVKTDWSLADVVKKIKERLDIK